MSSERAVRVGEQLRADLMELLLRGRLRDPATKDVVVTAVRMSPDLQHARVFVRTLDDANDRRQSRVLEGLERASGFLRREVAKGLRLRRTPELSFSWDDAVDRGTRVEKILAELADEAKAQEDSAQEDSAQEDSAQEEAHEDEAQEDTE